MKEGTQGDNILRSNCILKHVIEPKLERDEKTRKKM